jgi:FtsP/CotA-like multicopper oxidase with cupredoxin domain
MKGEAVDHQDAFTTETAGLPEASSPSVVRLYDGDSFDLRIHHVRKRVGDAEVRMLGYNGSIPGPTLHVDQGAEVTVNVTNDRDVETTVHWHGLRLENRYDGVPEETQALIPPGGAFTYNSGSPTPALLVPPALLGKDVAKEDGTRTALSVGRYLPTPPNGLPSTGS